MPTWDEEVRIDSFGPYEDFLRRTQAPAHLYAMQMEPAQGESVQRETSPTHRFLMDDLVEVFPYGQISIRAGQVAVVEDAPETSLDAAGCGSPGCHSCDRSTMTLIVPRLTALGEAADGTMLATYYVSVPPSCVRPIPAEIGQRGRCSNGQDVRHAEGHTVSIDCVSPVRIAGFGDCLDDMSESFERLWAPEVQAWRDARAAALARMGTFRAGDRFVITGTNSSYYGYFAEFCRVADHETGRIVVDIYNGYDDLIRRQIVISVASLGDKILSWHRSRQVPNFIRFTTTNYSGNVTVSDRGIAESIDQHDCTDRCFENGCTAAANLFGSNDDDDYYEDEEPEFHAGGIPIHSYSHRPNLIFSGAGPVYLGTELELSTGYGVEGERNQRRAARIITESPVGHLIYLKSDGSISGYGFEAVTHPMSYDYLVDNWPEDLLRAMRNAGAKPHSSCGMHVHVSRTGFSNPVHAYKWIKFMYRNSAHMRQMARRDPSEWGSFGQTAERKAAKWHAKGGYGAESRYRAVNCVPRDTYEVRIFASTLNHTRFLGSLGLVDASVEYTRQLTTEQILKHGGWEFEPFRAYASSFEKYKPLQKEMARILGK